MYKLIAIDMDGTLLDDAQRVSPQVKEALTEAKKLGVRIVLCSGRPIAGMRKYVKDLQLNDAEDYAIAYNGAFIQNTNTKQVISNLGLTYDNLVELYELSLLIDLPMNYFDGENLYSPSKTINRYTVAAAYLNDIPLHYRPVEDYPKDRPIANVMYVAHPDKLTAALKSLPSAIMKKYAMAHSAPHFVEFTHREATKGIALKRLAQRLGVKQKEIMAIGDNGNDLSMIKFAGCGVAMKNATPEVKAVADYETSSNNEHGVAEAIQKLVLDQMKV